MSQFRDGPTSPHFMALPFRGNLPLSGLAAAGVSEKMAAAVEHAPSGAVVAWGIPFEVGDVALLATQPVELKFAPFRAGWFVFMHTSDLTPPQINAHGFISPMRGEGQLGEHAADYVVRYEDGSELQLPIRRRYQLGPVQRIWGENCFEAVAHRKPAPLHAAHEQSVAEGTWGWSQTRVAKNDIGEWVNWLWAWQNPHPEKTIAGLYARPISGTVVLSGLAAGHARALPLRWHARRKAVLTLAAGDAFDPRMDEQGLLAQIRLDLGQVISATSRLLYANEAWAGSYNNQVPRTSDSEIVVEYTAHPDACFHLPGERLISVLEVEAGTGSAGATLTPVAPALQRVLLRAAERGSGRTVPVKLHIHGEAGEYLAPVDRHRIPNPAWFEDYSVDFIHQNTHACTYIPGVTTVDLPLGRVYIEVAKGFEIRPVRRVVEVTPETQEVIVEVEKVLPWREQGWVTADTHVHFLSPTTTLLEGAAEGLNVINLLATQLGELMTNVGDFDGKTTWGAREAGGDGEHLVRVGTENRQHVLGHISLLGYRGRIIAPMTTGGPDESALGDPIEILLTEWAHQCRQQGGVVVLPHFPQPRAEHAACIVSGEADALEMTSWGDLYSGISPYSLSDWYRYLNCGYLVPAVGGTDKMTAETAAGTVRTYARLAAGEPFTYDAWLEAVRRRETFVTYGPLLEFSVNGRPMGSRIELNGSGGTLDVTWTAASVTVPMSRVELVINGEIRESQVVGPEAGSGHWSVQVPRSAWLALLIRGHYSDKPEIIAAHSSPVMVTVAGTPLLAAADAVTILDQIEGSLAYLDTVGTRAEDRAYKRMRLVLTGAHRSLHNRMHQQGFYHDHTPETDHAEHRAGEV